MRKLFALMISVLLICTCAVSVCAAEAQYPTAGDLYTAWYGDLPDYICGVWSTDGGTSNLTFGIQNNAAGNAGKQEILELVENDLSVTFVYQEFSRNDLLQMQQQIDGYFGKNLGLISTGLDEMNNCIVLGIYQERKGNADTQNMIDEITGKYGKAVRVEYTEKIQYTVGEVETPYTWMTPYAQPALFLPMGVILLLVVGVFLVIAVRRKTVLLQTDSGTAASATQPPSAKDVEDMVKKSGCNVPSGLKHKVMTAIDEKK